MAEVLPDGNGVYSRWRPTVNRYLSIKPGMLKGMENRKVGDPYDPFRETTEDPWRQSYYWRRHSYSPAINDTTSTLRQDWYNNAYIQYNQNRYAQYTLEADIGSDYSYDGYYETLPIGTVSGRFASNESYSQTWWPLQSGPQEGTMTGRGRTITPSTAYYVTTDLFSYLQTYTANWHKQSYYTWFTLVDSNGHNGTLRWKYERKYTLNWNYGTWGIERSMFPYHTYRISCWVKAGVGNHTVSISAGTYYGEAVSLIQGDTEWHLVELEILGKDVPTPYYNNLTVYVGEQPTTTDYTHATGDYFWMSDPKWEDLNQGPGVLDSYTEKLPYCAVRTDTTNASSDVFQYLYDAYGCPTVGGAGPQDSWLALRDRAATVCGTGLSTGASASWNGFFRSYDGYVDPRHLTAGVTASYTYSRYMSWHPFCFPYYWTIHGDFTATVGNLFYTWEDLYKRPNYQRMTPLDMDPAFPIDNQFTYVGMDQVGYQTFPADPFGGGVWRSVDFDGDPVVTDSRFELEVYSAGYNNTSGAAGCVNHTPYAPIPSGVFHVWLVDDYNYDAIWPTLNPPALTLVATIAPEWTGSQNGSWTLTGMDITGVSSTYEISCSADLGIPGSRVIYGAVLSIKPHAMAQRKARFLITEEWSEAETQPWFVTGYEAEANRGNHDPNTSGFGTTHDVGVSYYTNSISVGIQPYFDVTMPAKWRYGIPWGAPSELEVDPPLRQQQRDDGHGMFGGHARLKQAGLAHYSSSEGGRLPGHNNSYR